MEASSILSPGASEQQVLEDGNLSRLRRGPRNCPSDDDGTRGKLADSLFSAKMPKIEREKCGHYTKFLIAQVSEDGSGDGWGMGDLAEIGEKIDFDGIGSM